MKQKLKGGFEWDVVLAPGKHTYLRKAGVKKQAKRQMNKRFRWEWKQEQQQEIVL